MGKSRSNSSSSSEESERESENQAKKEDSPKKEQKESSNGSNRSSIQIKVESVEENPNNLKVYRRRWLTLTLFCILTILNQIVWITFAPISDQVEDYFGINTFAVNMMSIVFLLAYLPVCFVASWTLDHIGFRYGVLIGASFNFVGAWIRVASLFHQNFASTVVGQTIAAIGQPFLLSASPKLAALWFPEHQRTLATTIAAVSSPVGVAIGFLIPPGVVSKSDDVGMLLLIEAIIVGIGTIPCVIFFSDRPPTPPSISAGETREENFWHSLRIIIKDFNVWVLVIEFGLSYAAFNALATVVNQLIVPYGYSNDESGYIGALTVLFGIVGSGIAGAFVDKTRIYKGTLFVCLVIATIFMVIFTIGLRPNLFPLLAVCASVIGLSMTPVIPVSLELSCETVYPVAEATPTGLLMSTSQVIAIVEILVATALIEADNARGAGWFFVVCFGLAALVTLLFRGKLKRLQAEKDKREAHQKEANNEASSKATNENGEVELP